MLLTLVALIGSMVVILLGAELFTNAVEWLGKKLGLGEGAVGSILAAVGTAMPETMIPIIAILFVGTEASEEIGIGAILGAPFMLSTAAFFVTGFAVTIFSRGGRRTTLMSVNTVILQRDMGYFLLVYAGAVASAFIPVHQVKVGIGFLLLALYGLYVMRTLQDEAEMGEEELGPLRFYPHHNPPPLSMVLVQFLVALGLIIVGARVFVSNVEEIAHTFGVPALVLALLIAPLATELPEKFNSVIWVRRGKDTLAMGNITGAMVFQSCIPVAVGLFFTPWELAAPALTSAVIALGSTILVLGSMRLRQKLTASVLMLCGLFYLTYVGYVVFLL